MKTKALLLIPILLALNTVAPAEAGILHKVVKETKRVTLFIPRTIRFRSIYPCDLKGAMLCAWFIDDIHDAGY